MGYRGKLEEQRRARELRAEAWTLQEIADELGVAKSSVSLWTRDVAFDPALRRSAATGRRPRGSEHPLRRRKLAEIERCRVEGIARVGRLDDRELLLAGLGLYAGDGSKRDGEVRFANSDPLQPDAPRADGPDGRDAERGGGGSGGRARTGDIFINSEALCQLSYPGKVLVRDERRECSNGAVGARRRPPAPCGARRPRGTQVVSGPALPTRERPEGH
jgi:hypothetical protein